VNSLVPLGAPLARIGPTTAANTNFHTSVTEFLDTFSMVRRRHTLKFGSTFYHYEKNENSANGNQGIFTVNTTGQPTAGNSSFERTWANFLLGRASNFRQDSVDLTAIIKTNQIEFFGQDEFHLRKNLTLTYGARFSFFRQPTDANNKLSNFDPAKFSSSAAPCIALNGTINANPITCPQAVNYNPLNGFFIAGKNSPFGNKVSNEDNKNIAPRLGLVWDPFSDGKTAIRAGYGVFYDSVLFGNAENDIFLNPAFNPQVNIPNTTLDNPGNAAVAAPSANPLRVRSLIATPYHTPYIQQWSLDVQRSLAKDFMLDVNVIQNHGYHLQSGYLGANQARLADYTAMAQADQTWAWVTKPGFNNWSGFGWMAVQPFPTVASTWGPLFTVGTPLGNSDYQSMQIALTKRVSHGLSFQATGFPQVGHFGIKQK